MHFLIDLENVNNTGMRGTEYLLPSDHLMIFYSDIAIKLESRYLEDIRNSCCFFEICKLIKPRKNALDFYIVTKVGEILGSGDNGKIVIISKDEGFNAAREYISTYSFGARRVYLAENIERGILSANMDDKRTNRIRRKIKSTNIEQFFADYENNQRIGKLLRQAFENTQYLFRVKEMEKILKNSKTIKEIYCNTLRQFGREDGLKVYQTLKGIALS